MLMPRCTNEVLVEGLKSCNVAGHRSVLPTSSSNFNFIIIYNFCCIMVTIYVVTFIPAKMFVFQVFIICHLKFHLLTFKIAIAANDFLK